MAKKVKAKAAPETAVEAPQGPILAQVRGHETQVKALADAVASGRLPATLIFTGPAGVGKKKIALGFAQVLVCENRKTGEGAACGECGPCIRVAKGSSESLLMIEPQGVGIKIEQAHDILQFVSLRQLGRGRMVIINEAHLLNPQAGNALLKALEEPPADTHFTLITANASALLSTIRSRAQTIRFQALPDAVIRDLTGAEDWVIRAAQGSLETVARLNENSEEWAAFRRLAFSQLQAFVHGQAFESDEFREALKDRGAALFIVQIWQRLLRDFAVARAFGGKAPKDRLLLPDQLALTEQGAGVPEEWLQQLADLAGELEQDINRNVDRQLAFDNFALSVRRAYTGREPHPVLA